MTEIRETILEAKASEELKLSILEDLSKENPVDYREIIRVHASNIEDASSQE